jgi:hypothetical protein
VNSNALQIDFGAGIGAEYSDNVRLTSSNEESDVIAIGYLGGSLTESTRDVKADLKTSLTHELYTDNTFGDQTYFKLGAIVDWDMISNFLTWNLQNYFTQERIDAAQRNVPTNLTDANSFATGPTITYAITQRQLLTLSAQYSNYHFDKLNSDSQQYSARLGWSYDLSNQTQFGVSTSVSKYEFEDDQLNPDFSSTNIAAFIAGQRARTHYDARVGYDSFNRDQFSDQKGFRSSINLGMDLTSISSLSALLSTKLQDSSSGSLTAQASPSQGNINNQQFSGDVSRDSIFRLNYTRAGTNLNAGIWTELRRLDYKETLLDRDVKEIGVRIKYGISSLLSTGIVIAYNDTDLEDTNSNFQDLSVDADVSYKLSRSLSFRLGIFANNRDSDTKTNEFDEFGVLVGLMFGKGTVASARRNNSGINK